MAVGRLAIGVGAAIGVSLCGCGGDDDTTAAPPSPPVVPAPTPPWPRWDQCPVIATPQTSDPTAPERACVPGQSEERGYTGVPTDGSMHYYVVFDPNNIPDYQPECVSSFCDDNVGMKMPDSCCDPEAWKKDGNTIPGFFDTGPDDRTAWGEEDEATCYVRDAPGPFNGGTQGRGGREMQAIRNYLGCECGQLYAHENCVPATTAYVNREQYGQGAPPAAGWPAEGAGAGGPCDTGGSGCPWAYPMSKAAAKPFHTNGTGSSCRCSRQSFLAQGPGCYIAFATLAQFQNPEPLPAVPSVWPAVFVKIEGSCNNTVPDDGREWPPTAATGAANTDTTVV